MPEVRPDRISQELVDEAGPVRDGALGDQRHPVHVGCPPLVNAMPVDRHALTVDEIVPDFHFNCVEFTDLRF